MKSLPKEITYNKPAIDYQKYVACLGEKENRATSLEISFPAGQTTCSMNSSKHVVINNLTCCQIKFRYSKIDYFCSTI